MKTTVFSNNEITEIINALDYVNDFPEVSFLYERWGYDSYSYYFEEAYDKLLAYCPLTNFNQYELSVIDDALRPYCANIPIGNRSAAFSAKQKARAMLVSVLGTKK